MRRLVVFVLLLLGVVAFAAAVQEMTRFRLENESSHPDLSPRYCYVPSEDGGDLIIGGRCTHVPVATPTPT